MTDKENRGETESGTAPRLVPPRVIPADELFKGQQEVWIDHDGVLYRLRITRRKKLILQK
jgi:hemin uptake protein HemP